MRFLPAIQLDGLDSVKVIRNLYVVLLVDLIHSMDLLPETEPEKLALLYVQQWLHEQGHMAGTP